MASEHGTGYPAWAVAKDARQQAGLSVESVAELTGFTVQRIVDIEAADVSPTADELFVIVRECGFELRMSVARLDHQRIVHGQAAQHRDATARIAANTAGLRAYEALRHAARD